MRVGGFICTEVSQQSHWSLLFVPGTASDRCLIKCPSLLLGIIITASISLNASSQSRQIRFLSYTAESFALKGHYNSPGEEEYIYSM